MNLATAFSARKPSALSWRGPARGDPGIGKWNRRRLRLRKPV